MDGLPGRAGRKNVAKQTGVRNRPLASFSDDYADYPCFEAMDFAHFFQAVIPVGTDEKRSSKAMGTRNHGTAEVQKNDYPCKEEING